MRYAILVLTFASLLGFSGHPAGAQTDRASLNRKRSTQALSPLTSWSRKIDNARQRFDVLDAFGNHAVLDHETSLVWERLPSSEPRTWLEAVGHCYGRNIGNRLGWRLATVEELTSLIDPAESLPRFLPAGHPFDVDESTGREYWTSTSLASTPPNAFIIRTSPFEGPFVGVTTKSFQVPLAWCVRGGHGPAPDVPSE
jgi:hypothetical protein